MEPRAVVEALDVLEHAAARLRPGIEGEVIEPLGLQGMEEALRRCIVETIAGPAHAADHPVLIEELLVVGARVGGEFNRSSQHLEMEVLNGTTPRVDGDADRAAGNAVTRGGQLDYRASIAQWKADLQARRPKTAKLASADRLRAYVQDRLAGTIARIDGKRVPGPEVRFIGRRHGRRADRRWATSWSPEQISNRLRLDFPEDATMRISHEAIYQALFIQGRGALKRELVACLRTGRALRVPRARTKGRGKPFVTPEIMITERPADVAERAVPGHWEGDLIIGLNKSAIGTLVERTTRFTMLLHLPPMEGHGEQPRGKNGPPLAGHGAEAVRDEIARVIETLPEQLRRSLTWDQGTEMAQHAQLRVDTGLAIYFCDPHSPWQRGTNENTNGLLRQYFPKGTDLHRHRREDIDAVALALNTRPRKTLGWRTPAEALDEHLRSIQKSSVATTG